MSELPADPLVSDATVAAWTQAAWRCCPGQPPASCCVREGLAAVSQHLADQRNERRDRLYQAAWEALQTETKDRLAAAKQSQAAADRLVAATETNQAGRTPAEERDSLARRLAIRYEETEKARAEAAHWRAEAERLRGENTELTAQVERYVVDRAGEHDSLEAQAAAARAAERTTHARA